MVGCPSSALCILQGQGQYASYTGWWYPDDGGSYPNRLITTQWSQTPGVTYTISPNPVNIYPATYAVAFNVSLTAPIGIQNVAITGTSNDGSTLSPDSFSYYICSATTGSCVGPTPTPTSVPTPIPTSVPTPTNSPHISNAIFPQPSGTTPPAIYTTLHEELSPDKTWDAKLYQEFYEGDYPFQTATIVTLRLTSVSHPAIASDVFAYDTGGNSLYNPTFLWTTPHALSISTLNTQYMTLHMTSYSNVSISYKYSSKKQ
jgi:hypothetical protein